MLLFSTDVIETTGLRRHTVTVSGLDKMAPELLESHLKARMASLVAISNEFERNDHRYRVGSESDVVVGAPEEPQKVRVGYGGLSRVLGLVQPQAPHTTRGKSPQEDYTQSGP